MPFKILTPLLRTNAFAETVDFYTNIFGFVCKSRNDDWGWASLSSGAVEIMIATPNVHMPFAAPAFTGSLYIVTDEVDELWNRLKDQVVVAYPIETFEWNMREFAIYDNNGYMLQFGQEMD